MNYLKDMPKDRVIGTYLVRFIEKKQQPHISLHDLRTGEQLEFETWVSAWAFLEEALEEDSGYFPKLEPKP